MIMRFDERMLKPADILAGRNLQGKQAPLIRSILGSYTNHNAIVLKHETKGMCIGDTTPPTASIVPLSQYEKAINTGTYVVRIWRVRNMTDRERLDVCRHWLLFCKDTPYPSHGIYRLWVFRIVNHLPYEIGGQWCTKNTLRSFSAILPPSRDPRRRMDGEMKLNPTPRTMENRLVAGILEDVTDRVLIPSHA